MSRRQREKKALRIEQEQAEKKQIEQRKQEKMLPVYRTGRKLAVAVIATLFLLYLGVVINTQLPDILTRLTENS